ncbi:MAG: type II secretion system protein GspG [Desulfuromonas sp.]|nr:MAG: type II secretion system protein GspG [Desulfuromonas sp.]
MKFQSEKGFTFIEIMVVVIILGVLAAIVLPKFTGRTQEARINAAESQVGVFATALDAYELDNGGYPTTEQGLSALSQEPTVPPTPTRWKGPYLQKAVGPDPWGGEYQYKSPGQRNPRSYDLLSYGPDKREGGGDDITNW